MRRSLYAWIAALLVLGALGAPAQTGSTSYVSFNFDRVDLGVLVKLVGDMTGRRFVVDAAVTGKVTVVTPPRIPREEVYPLFLSILESSGYSVIEKGNLYYVVPLAERAVPSAPVLGEDEPAREGIITKVIRVQNISAVELKKILEPMVRGGKAGHLAAFGPTNHLIITDTGDNVRRIEKIIAELDKPGAARVVEVVKLERAAAEEVAAQLITAMKGAEAAGSKISRHVQQVAEGESALPTDVVVVPSPAANSLVIVGTPVQLQEVKRIIEKMDVETRQGYGRLNAIFLRYLGAEDAAKSLNALLAKTVDKDQRQKIAIEPSAANNALIVEATPQDFEKVKQLVDSLDQPPEQVMVEILIAEVAVGKDIDLGVEWSTIEIPEEGKTTVIGRSRPSEEDDIFKLISEGVFPQGLLLGIADGTYIDGDGKVQPRIPFLIRALAANKDVNILSNVPLLAQNNKEATVSVVENIPILRSTIEGGSGTSRDVIQNIDRMDVGIKLKFTPHVNPDGEISMQLNPSIEAVTDKGSSDTKFTPTISKREVSTTVTLPDKATVVLSGLIREDRIKAVYKVPILGDIPLLGMLFRNTVDRRQRTNLLIFVTPHIVRDMKDAAALEETLRQRAAMNVSATNLMPRAAKPKPKRK